MNWHENPLWETKSRVLLPAVGIVVTLDRGTIRESWSSAPVTAKPMGHTQTQKPTESGARIVESIKIQMATTVGTGLVTYIAIMPIVRVTSTVRAVVHH